MQRTIRITHDRTRLELDVRLEKKDPSGTLDSTTLEPIDEPYHALSISMGRWVRRGPRSPWREDCVGQDIGGVRAFAKHCAPPVALALERLCAIWAEWHLNDLTAGTVAQMEAISVAKAAGEIQTTDWYGSACLALEARGLLVDRGYRFGTKWLTRRLPQDVQREVVALCEALTTV